MVISLYTTLKFPLSTFLHIRSIVALRSIQIKIDENVILCIGRLKEITFLCSQIDISYNNFSESSAPNTCPDTL